MFTLIPNRNETPPHQKADITLRWQNRKGQEEVMVVGYIEIDALEDDERETREKLRNGESVELDRLFKVK